MIVKEIKVKGQQLKNKHKLQDLILTMEIKDKIKETKLLLNLEQIKFMS